MDSRTLHSTPESGEHVGYDGAKRRNGSKVYLAVDTLGHLLTLHVTDADEQAPAQVEQLARAVQEVTSNTVEVGFVEQGYTGRETADQSAKQGLTCWWTSIQKQKNDSCCCRAAGWSNAALAGPHDFAGWRAIMSDSRKPWPGCTTSPLYASYSVKPSLRPRFITVDPWRFAPPATHETGV